MRTLLYFTFCTIFLVTSCNDDSPQPDYYLDQWVGEYLGNSYHWSSYPVGDTMQFFERYNKLLLEVVASDVDSAVDLFFTYNDTIFSSSMELYISPKGIHDSAWGGGSSFGRLYIEFDSVSIDYNYFSKCGIPCSGGTEFKIYRIPKSEK